MEMIRNQTARNLMYSWHGGMSSPFYAAASSGLVADWPDLIEEFHTCQRVTVAGSKDFEDLQKLLVWLTVWQSRSNSVTVNGVNYSALPWAKGEWK